MCNLKKINNFVIENYNHFFALILLSIYYFLSLIIFNEVVVKPHDNLDLTVVYDHIIGRIFNGDFDAASYFLSGTLKWFYIENIFYPTNLLHLILDNKQYYFTIEISKKILSYFTFYILAKSISKNKFSSSVSALVYSSVVNLEKLFGFGIVMMPYFLYLLINKQKLKPKHFFIIIFVGLNSTLVRDYLALCLLIPTSILIKQSLNNLNTMIGYFSSISISIAISSIPIILSLIDINDIHRAAFEINDYYFNLNNFLNNFLAYFSFVRLKDLYPLPKLFLYFFILYLSITSRRKNLISLAFFIILIFTVSLFINSFLKNIFFSNFLNFLQGFNFQRIDRVLPLIISILVVYNLNLLNNSSFKKIIYFLSIFTVIIIQISIPTKEVGKLFLKNNLKENKYIELKKNVKNNNSYIKLAKLLLDGNNYKTSMFSYNLNSTNTFDNYYRFEEYSFIKSVVKQERVISVGLDPFIAVMSDIKVIDGYHTIYSMDYKKRFREIIADELEANDFLRKYYDNWGNRVYAFFTDSNKLLINFKAAKSVGANYVISAFPIKNVELESICENCRDNKDIFLYKIL